MQIGQHVVLVDDKWRSPLHDITYPVRGVVYTVREIVEWYSYNLNSWDTCIRLEEITNPVFNYLIAGETEQAFLAARFKPLQKWDVSKFQKELEPIEA